MPSPNFPTRSQTRLPPPTPLSASLVRLTLGVPCLSTPFLHPSPHLPKTPITLTLSPPPPSATSATTIPLCSTTSAAAATAASASHHIPPFWLDLPLSSRFSLSIEALSSSEVVGVAGITLPSVASTPDPSLASTSTKTIHAALVSPMTSNVVTTLSFSSLVITPLPPTTPPPSLPPLLASPHISLSLLPTTLPPFTATPSSPSDPSRTLSSSLAALPHRLPALLHLRPSPIPSHHPSPHPPRRPRPVHTPDQNIFADAVLTAVAASPTVAALIADDPDLCTVLALKQTALPVLCRVHSARAAHNTDGDGAGVAHHTSPAELLPPADATERPRADPRVADVEAAAVFAQSVGLRGLVVDAHDLRAPRGEEMRAAVRNRALALVAVVGRGAGTPPLESVMAELAVDGVVRCGEGGAGECVVEARGALFGPGDVRVVDEGEGEVVGGGDGGKGGEVTAEDGKGCGEEGATFVSEAGGVDASMVEELALEGGAVRLPKFGTGSRVEATRGRYPTAEEPASVRSPHRDTGAHLDCRSKSVRFSDPVVTPPQSKPERRAEAAL